MQSETTVYALHGYSLCWECDQTVYYDQGIRDPEHTCDPLLVEIRKAKAEAWIEGHSWLEQEQRDHLAVIDNLLRTAGYEGMSREVAVRGLVAEVLSLRR